jgi:hypothetical protein
MMYDTPERRRHSTLAQGVGLSLNARPTQFGLCAHLQNSQEKVRELGAHNYKEKCFLPGPLSQRYHGLCGPVRRGFPARSPLSGEPTGGRFCHDAAVVWDHLFTRDHHDRSGHVLPPILTIVM